MLELSFAEITSHGKLDLKLLLFLVEFAANDILVDSVDNQVFQLADRGHVEFGEEAGVGEDLRAYERGREKGRWKWS